MEKEINPSEERLFDLLETKNFGELTIEEKSFVLSFLTEENYTFQRRILMEASEGSIVLPEVKPLSLPASKKQFKTIPLYQAVLAVAAVVLLFILIWPQNTIVSTSNQIIKKTDTVFVAQDIIHDTIVKFVNLGKTVVHVHDTIQTLITQLQAPATETRLLEVQNNFNLPALSTELFVSKGISLKEDSSFTLGLPRFLGNADW